LGAFDFVVLDAVDFVVLAVATDSSSKLVMSLDTFILKYFWGFDLKIRACVLDEKSRSLSEMLPKKYSLGEFAYITRLFQVGEVMRH
jgi:hypothetical protein